MQAGTLRPVPSPLHRRCSGKTKNGVTRSRHAVFRNNLSRHLLQMQHNGRAVVMMVVVTMVVIVAVARKAGAAQTQQKAQRAQ